MLFFPLSEIVKSAGAWRCCERRTRLTQSDNERSPDNSSSPPMHSAAFLSVSPIFSLTFTSLLRSVPVSLSTRPNLSRISPSLHPSPLLLLLHHRSLLAPGLCDPFQSFSKLVKVEGLEDLCSFNSLYLITSLRSVNHHPVVLKGLQTVCVQDFRIFLQFRPCTPQS